MTIRRWQILATTITAALTITAGPSAQQTPGSGAALTVVSREGRRALPLTTIDGQPMLAVDDLADMFQASVRQDRLTEGLIVSYQGQTIVLSVTDGLVSVAGRVISLPAPPAERDGRWYVPVDFLSRALARIHSARIEVRRVSGLVLVGDIRVPRITVSSEPSGARARLVVDSTPATPHAISLERERNRLVIDFEADMLDAALPARLPEEYVAGMRVAPGSTSLVIDLGPEFGAFRSTPDDGSGRVVLDLLPAAPATSATPTAPPDPPPPLPFDLRPASAVRTVVIDPGHGGEEDGAHGLNGTLEKHVTLSVALQVKTAIENRLGLRVLLTREADDTVRLDERAAIANNNKADVFISLHANASVRPSASGAEVFYLSMEEYGDEARSLAETEGQVLPVVGGGTRPIEIILWDMAQARHVERSEVLAQMIESQLRGRLPMSPRSIQQAPLRVLVGANMAAALVEMGFISNPVQERQLASAGFQQSVVQAIVEAIIEFRNYIERGRAGRQAAAVAGQSGDP